MDDAARLRVLRQQIKALDRLIAEQFRARDEAIRVVAQTTDYVRSQQNEWRSALSDLALTKVDRQAFDSQVKALLDQIAVLRDEVAQNRGKDSGIARDRSALLALGVGLVAFAGLVYTVLTNL